MNQLDNLRACSAFLLDLDGTIYVDNVLVPGAKDLLSLLQDRKIPHLFLTNNSSARAEDYQSRLKALGIHADKDQILTSGEATIDHLLSTTAYRSACVLGTANLQEEFKAAGFDIDAADPDCVVVGFDKTLTYEKLKRACSLIFKETPYYATHPDNTCITANGLIPDIGAIIAAIYTVTSSLPKIIGKPQPEMVQAALKRLNAQAENTVMIGDQIDTDMTMARMAGLCGVLVLSGETSAEQANALPDEKRPNLIASSVAEVFTWLS